MNVFSNLYHKIIALSLHPKASYYLAGLSVVEATLLPFPPDIILAPMVLSKPQNAWRYAGLTTFFSVLGGLVGYLLGALLFSLIEGWVQTFGYEASYLRVQAWFVVWGFWAILLAGFTPVPYKIFTIAAGASGMPLLPFILGSLAGRGSRFYLVSAVMRWGGRSMERVLLRYIEWLGWLLAATFLFYVVWRIFH